jgi:hypothetical protein
MGLHVVDDMPQVLYVSSSAIIRTLARKPSFKITKSPRHSAGGIDSPGGHSCYRASCHHRQVETGGRSTPEASGLRLSRSASVASRVSV